MPEVEVTRPDGYEDLEICAVCGGACCKDIPGAYFPADILGAGEAPLDTLVRLFETGKYAVDWWEGDPDLTRDTVERGFFIRPAHRGAQRLLDPSWGGKECVHLTPTGCELALEARPTQCRMLRPKAGGLCHLDEWADKRHSALSWEPYWETIETAAKVAKEQRGKVGQTTGSRS